MQNAHQAYLTQRSNAFKRGIVWELTEREWIEWWESTGHFSDRGRGKGKWLMARFNDTGAYSLNNIFCHRHECNVSDAQKSKPKSAEQKKKMSNNAARHNAKRVITPDGVFNSAAEAGRYYKITGEAINWRVKQTIGQYKEWKHADY